MTSAVVDHSGLDALSFEASLILLDRAPIGRIAFREDGEVMVLPVFHSMDGQDVVFRTNGGSLLDLAARGGPVSFEVDGPAGPGSSGWSVLVTGVVHLVVDPDEQERLDRLPLTQWNRGGDRFWVRIRPSSVTGRRVPHLPEEEATRR